MRKSVPIYLTIITEQILLGSESTFSSITILLDRSCATEMYLQQL